MVIAPNSNNDDEARTQMIDSFVALTQKFFDEEDQFIVLEASEQIALLHEMASILEREERVFEETMNDPFEIDRENFMIQKLLSNIREDLVESLANQLLLSSDVEENLMIAGMRFFLSCSLLLDPKTLMNEELIDRLLKLISDNSEYQLQTGTVITDRKLTSQNLKMRVFATGILSIASFDDDASNYIVTKKIANYLLYQLKYYIHNRPKRIKYDADKLDEKGMTGDEKVDPTELTDDHLHYFELKLIIRMLENIADYLEVIGPVLEEGAMDLISPLLQLRDKFLLGDVLKVCSVLMTHQKFAQIFVDKGGLKQILKIPKKPYLIGGVGLCLRDLAQLTTIMDRLCRSTPYMEKIVEHCLLLLESSGNEVKKIGCIFFNAAFSYTVTVQLFDKNHGLKTLLNVFRIPISFPQSTVIGKSVSHCALLALRSYLRMHFLLVGQNLQKKSKRKPILKFMDMHKVLNNQVILDLVSRNMNSLVSYLQRTPWKPAVDFIEYDGPNLLLELINISSFWNATQVAHCALEVLQLLTIAPVTHLTICEEKLDNGRTGLGVILETAAATSNNEVFIMETALQTIVNIICLPEGSVNIQITQSRRRICDLLRTNDGLRILIDILRYATPTNADSIRAYSCKALLGLSQDATINQILRKMDVSEIISDLLKQQDKEHSGEFLKFQEYALQLLAKTTGREPKTISREARDHTLVRLEKAAIVANTQISYHDKELMQVIHEYLNSRGMNTSANTLLAEAEIEPLSAASKPIVSKPSESTRLDRIVTQYLRNQHRECENPVSVLPPFSLLGPHKCPPSYHLGEASQNIVSRMLAKHLNPTRKGIFTHNARRQDRKFLFSRFRHVNTLRDDDAPFITCAAFDNTGDTIYCGTDYGDVFQFDVISGDKLSTNNLGTIVDEILLSKDSSTMLAWMEDSVKLYSTDSFASPVFEFPEIQAALFSSGNDLIVGTGQKSTFVYDARTGEKLATLVDPQLDQEWEANVACFNPYDDLILSDAVLWDFRIPHQVIHRFDRLTTNGYGIFHPAGHEVIINSEIWDLRTLKLRSTCPALSQTVRVSFSPTNDVIYAIYSADNNFFNPLDNKSKDRDHTFRVIDSKTYETIASIDVDRSITDFAVDSYNNYVACVVDETANVSSTCRLYEVGRAKRGEGNDDESDEEEEEMDEEDDEDGIHLDSGSDFDIDEDFLYENEMDEDDDETIDLEALLNGADLMIDEDEDFEEDGEQ